MWYWKKTKAEKLCFWGGGGKKSVHTYHKRLSLIHFYGSNYTFHWHKKLLHRNEVMHCLFFVVMKWFVIEDPNTSHLTPKQIKPQKAWDVSARSDGSLGWVDLESPENRCVCVCVCVYGRVCWIAKNGHYHINGYNPCVLSRQSHQRMIALLHN